MGLTDFITRGYERCVGDWKSLVENDEYVPYLYLKEALVCDEVAVPWASAGYHVIAQWWSDATWSQVRPHGGSQPDWASFLDICELADRIDHFLYSMERHGPGPNLADECRRDLTALLVLADWCEEHDLLTSASEARYLHGLVRCWR
jgi:hypothetical protein